MLTRRIDAALEALAACRDRAPALRDIFRVGTPERARLDELVEALRRADEALAMGRRAPRGAGQEAPPGAAPSAGASP